MQLEIWGVHMIYKIIIKHGSALGPVPGSESVNC